MIFTSKWRPNKDAVIVENGLVTANHPQSAEVGFKILKQGGNAIDAGVAMGFCNTVIAPFTAGLAGQGIMLIYLAEEDRTIALNFNAKSPSGATPDMYKITGVTHRGINIFEVANNEMRGGPKSVCVPGTPAGLYKAHELYGKLPIKRVMKPAITFASEGFKVRPYMTYQIANLAPRIRSRPVLAEMWLKDERPPSSVLKEKVAQRDLGRLLKQIAEEGPEDIYKGKTAEAIVKELQQGGGILTKEDLAKYEPKFSDPMEISYKDYKIMTVPAPIGGQTVLETLNILENFNLESLEHNNVKYLHILIESARHAFADRYRYLGDWNVSKVPVKGLLSKKYSGGVAAEVDLERASLEDDLDEEPWAYYLEREIHDPWKYDPGSNHKSGFFSASTDHENGTTHFNVVDKERNIVCCTHFGGFGEGGIPLGSGIYLNGHMGQLIPVAGHPNSVEGNKHPLTNDSPLMILEDGKPLFCLGAPGGRKIINRVTQVLLNVIEFRIGIQDACAMPTVDASSMVTLVSSRLQEKVINKLKSKGHKIKVVNESPFVNEFARPSGILLDPDTGLLKGGVEVLGSAIGIGY